MKNWMCSEIISPLADPKKYSGSLVDFNLRAERMGWLPSAPQLNRIRWQLSGMPKPQGIDPVKTSGGTVQDRRAGISPAQIRTRRKTSRAICSSGVRTCSAPPARATNTC